MKEEFTNIQKQALEAAGLPTENLCGRKFCCLVEKITKHTIKHINTIGAIEVIDCFGDEEQGVIIHLYFALPLMLRCKGEIIRFQTSVFHFGEKKWQLISEEINERWLDVSKFEILD